MTQLALLVKCVVDALRTVLGAARVRQSAAHLTGPTPQARLAEQLPRARFPAGVAVPSAVVYSLVAVLCVFAAVTLRPTRPDLVPDELLASQQRLVEQAARSIGISAQQGLTDLRTAADPVPGAPAALVDAVLRRQPRWLGAVLLDPNTRVVLARSGEAVPVSALPAVVNDSVQLLPRPGAPARLLVAIPLSGAGQQGRVLAAVGAAALPDVPADAASRQEVVLLTPDGQAVGPTGGASRTQDPSVRPLIERAIRAANGSTGGAVVGEPTGRARQLSPDAPDRTTTVVAYGPVTVEGGLAFPGVGVVSVIDVPVVAAQAAGRGLLPATSLAVIGLLGFLLIQLAVTAPVRRLRDSMLSVASGQLRPRAGRYPASEIRRIAAAAEFCRLTFRGERPMRQRRRPGLGAGLIVGVAVAGLLGWSAVVGVTLGRADVSVPSSLVASSRTLLGATADSLRRTLSDGLADLRTIAGLSGGAPPGGIQPLLARFVAQQTRYRSVYVVGPEGDVVATAGREPLRGRAKPPTGEGITQHNTQGRVPVLLGHTPLPGNRLTLIGEFNVAHLSGLLRRAPGRVRLVDAELRTLAANGGFVAFEKLTDAPLRRAVGDARTATLTASVTDVEGGRSLVGAAVVAAPARTAALNWVVVADQPVDTLALAGNEVRRIALLLALVGVVLAVMLVCWQHPAVVRPLHRVADSADRLLAGETGAVFYPQRLDEIGTIASCLEICRQALVDGVDRLGEVRSDPTAGRAADSVSPSRHGR